MKHWVYLVSAGWVGFPCETTGVWCFLMEQLPYNHLYFFDENRYM